MLVRHYKSKKSVDFFIYPSPDTLFGTVSRAELTITASLPAYVLGAVKHGCLEWLRNEKNRLNIRQQIHTTAYHSIQARITALEACDPGQLFASEVAAIVQEEIARMPEPMRGIFVASRFEGKT